jgi:hypothetical protein
MKRDVAPFFFVHAWTHAARACARFELDMIELALTEAIQRCSTILRPPANKREKLARILRSSPEKYAVNWVVSYWTDGT